MTAPHFFVDPGERDQFSPGDRLRLSQSDSRHALRALRLRVGEEVTVSDDSGWVARGRLAGQEDGRAIVEVVEAKRVLRERPAVNVAMAPPKGDRLSWAVQKLAELGVTAITLVQTDRGVRFPSESGLERLRVVAREAAMQARRPFVTSVDAGDTLGGMFDGAPGHLDVVLAESATVRLSAVLPEGVQVVRLIVGPEGGWSRDELRLAEGRGAPAASLGPGILRTETAAVVGAALALARYGLLG